MFELFSLNQGGHFELNCYSDREELLCMGKIKPENITAVCCLIPWLSESGHHPACWNNTLQWTKEEKVLRCYPMT